MAASKSFLLAGALLCLAYVRSEVIDLQPAVSSTETTLKSVKTHVDHMLNLSPIPDKEKLKSDVKNKIDHLAYETKQFATKLHDKVRSEVIDLQPAVSSTETTLKSAKTHVDHMLNLSPIPNEEKLKSVVKNESDHLAYEIKQFVTKLHDKVSVGDHKAELKAAVTAAVTQLNEAAASLEHVGSDLKQDNAKFYAAAEKVLQEAKTIASAGPCDQLAPVVKGALEELTHDVNNYQYGIHEVVGPHEGAPTEAGHIHDHGHHHVHQHFGGSSEESKESHESHDHHH